MTAERRAEVRRALWAFHRAGRALVELWDAELEEEVDHEAARRVLTASFDEWLDEFLTLFPGMFEERP